MGSGFLSDVGFLSNNMCTSVTITVYRYKVQRIPCTSYCHLFIIHNVTKAGITDTLLYVFDRTSCATALTLNWMLCLATDLILILLRK
jgi:hypothetical protein